MAETHIPNFAKLRPIHQKFHMLDITIFQESFEANKTKSLADRDSNIRPTVGEKQDPSLHDFWTHNKLLLVIICEMFGGGVEGGVNSQGKNFVHLELSTKTI